MPQKIQGVRGVQFRLCDRCKFQYYLDQLRRQKGLLLCPTCVDDLSIEYRPKIIQQVLAQPGEGVDESSEMFKDPGEYVEF